MTKQLIADGYAYEVDGSVYFSVAKFPDYGKLSGRHVEELEDGARVAVRDEKRHPADFALWKKAEPEHILRWPSPWGWGYPGWHIECSVMATKYLGKPSTFMAAAWITSSRTTNARSHKLKPPPASPSPIIGCSPVRSRWTA